MPLPGDLAQMGDLFEHPLGLVHDAQADGGDADFGAAALEQDHAQLVLQLAYRHRQGGLADEAGFRGAPEMPLAGDGNDVLEFGQCHTCNPQLRR